MKCTTDILKEYYEDIKNTLGYNICSVRLFGSQNYGCDITASDVDAVAIVIPTTKDLIMGKRYIPQKKYDTGICTIKDIREYCRLIDKGSPNVVETIFTDYYVNSDNIPNYLSAMFTDTDIKEKIINTTRYNMLKATLGMMLNHRYNIFDITKPYDGKLTCNLYRLKRLFDRLAEQNNTGNPFMEPDQEAKYLMQRLKMNELTGSEMLQEIGAILNWLETDQPDLIIKNAKQKDKEISIMTFAYNSIIEENSLGCDKSW